MNLRQCLINGHIMGLETVIQAVDQFFRFHDVIPFDSFTDEEQELYEDLATSDVEDEELIDKVLKEKFEVDIAELDSQLDAGLAWMNERQEEKMKYFNRVVEKINKCKSLVGYDKYFDCGDYLLHVFYDWDSAAWVYETIAKKEIYEINDFLGKDMEII